MPGQFSVQNWKACFVKGLRFCVTLVAEGAVTERRPRVSERVISDSWEAKLPFSLQVLNMAKKKEAPEQEGLLVSAAKTIGKAAGKIASVAGVTPEAGEHPAGRKKQAKLPPKNKARLPRRQKKAQKKKQMAA